ncbi:MAG: dGTP triphosphohydrolase [Planctomycetota bacterium]
MISRSAEGEARVHSEEPDPLRKPFEVDRHRIIECTAFRRLEGKTQVFLVGRHDHFRTRLTHTLEVAQIARTVAANLGADEALAEAIALAHDLGHPPFGHAGEKSLNERMAAHDGFNHNAHSLRVVEFLEHPFPAFRGLNLTLATLAGLAGHETRFDQPASGSGGGVGRDVREKLAHSVEARIASAADAIAYHVHDLEDAIGAELVTADEVSEIGIWNEAAEPIVRRLGPRPIHTVRRVVLDGILDRLLTDLVRSASRSVAGSCEPLATRPPVFAHSPSVAALMAELGEFLQQRVYGHPDVRATDTFGSRMVSALFEAYRRQPEQLPERFLSRVPAQGLERVICDYVAGMTDRFCEREADRLGVLSR